MLISRCKITHFGLVLLDFSEMILIKTVQLLGKNDSMTEIL